MKLSNAILLSAVLLLGVSFAATQDRDRRDNNSNAQYQTVQYNNNGDFQRGYQDGINSGRSDANGNKRSNVESHPYYRNSNNQAYREGFMRGYREAYGQVRGGNGYNSYNNNRNGYYDNNGQWHERDHDRDNDNNPHL